MENLLNAIKTELQGLDETKLKEGMTILDSMLKEL